MEATPDKSAAPQFSLRKLFLWIAVCAMYLSVLRVGRFGQVSTSVLTVWFAVILLARLRWGLKGGMIAVSGVAVVWGGVMPLPFEGGYTANYLPLFATYVTVGIPFGMLLLLFVCGAVWLVNRVDSIGRRVDGQRPDS